MNPFPSRTELIVLRLLSEGGEQYGLQLVGASDGKLSRGGVYVLLGRLEQKGLVKGRRIPAPDDVGGLPRRLYKISALGMRALTAAEAFVGKLVPRIA